MTDNLLKKQIYKKVIGFNKTEKSLNKKLQIINKLKEIIKVPNR